MTGIPSMLRGGARKSWGVAWLLLCLTMLFWAGNSVVGRAAHGVVPPMALTFWRWTMALMVTLPLAWPHLRRDWPAIRRSWRFMLLLGLAGMATFPSVLYWALQYTTALNSILLQAAIPPTVLLASWLVYGERTGAGQLGGVLVSLVGVLVVITQGRLATLLQLRLNPGDAAILIGIALYAIYPPMLRRRPDMHPLSVLCCMFAVAALAIAPLYVAEMASGRLPSLTPQTFLSIGYVSVFASAGAFLCFNRGVALIGAGRAGQFIHLMPVFGAVLAVLLLHETLHLYHLAGVVLIAGGIGLSSLGRRPAAASLGG